MVGVLRLEALPQVATQLLVEGADTPGLRNLAALDLGPFDPRDARDLLDVVAGELAIDREPLLDQARRAAHVLAHGVVSGRLSAREGLRRFQRLAAATEYPNDPAITHLYGLEDEWDAGWGRGNDVIEAEVRTEMARIANRLPAPADCLLDAL